MHDFLAILKRMLEKIFAHYYMHSDVCSSFHSQGTHTHYVNRRLRFKLRLYDVMKLIVLSACSD